ncbi:hypothetical protein [Absidia glauca]|uniref:SCP2 domain-containing protein n=1 Tax=Absidia glauca TaxID=4829 RepID=A0A163J391_ABSGL|nr:hypothetical protein [Absidia glauca]
MAPYHEQLTLYTMALNDERREQVAKDAIKGKVRTVRIQVEDSDALNLVTGGVTGIKTFMTGRVKVKGDLLLAQRLEEAVEKMRAREVGFKEKYV